MVRNKFGFPAGRSDGCSEDGKEDCGDKLSQREVGAQPTITPQRRESPAIGTIGGGADMVNHPPHYTAGGIECIDALEAATIGLRGIEAVCTANAIKYLWRWKQKGGKQDLEKAIWYIRHMADKQ